jgi:hypothetical protein
VDQLQLGTEKSLDVARFKGEVYTQPRRRDCRHLDTVSNGLTPHDFIFSAGLYLPFSYKPQTLAVVLHLRENLRRPIATNSGPDHSHSARGFVTPGPVLVGVHVDYWQNVKLFQQVYEDSIL